ncbi:hypothetical protein [Promicromonospora sp. NPDC023987]
MSEGAVLVRDFSALRAFRGAKVLGVEPTNRQALIDAGGPNTTPAEMRAR